MEFLADTRATYSVLNTSLPPVSDEFVTVEGATRQTEKAYSLHLRVARHNKAHLVVFTQEAGNRFGSSSPKPGDLSKDCSVFLQTAG